MPPVPEEQEDSSSLVSHESPEEIPNLLPKLPLPKVEESVEGFLDAIEAVVDKVLYLPAERMSYITRTVELFSLRI